MEPAAFILMVVMETADSSETLLSSYRLQKEEISMFTDARTSKLLHRY
jgi:hypothetical protein